MAHEQRKVSEAQPKDSKPLPPDLASIHKGDIFFENAQGGSVQIVALTEPVLNGELWTFTGWTGLGMNIDFLVNLDYRHYGPRFSDTPEYYPVNYLTSVTDLPTTDHSANTDAANAPTKEPS